MPLNAASAWFRRTTHLYCESEFVPGNRSIIEQVGLGGGEREELVLDGEARRDRSPSDPEPLGWFRGKSIVRPLLVNQFYGAVPLRRTLYVTQPGLAVHRVRQVASANVLPYIMVPAEDAIIRHLRVSARGRSRPCS